MTEWNSIHRPSWRGKESELFITNNKPLFLLKTNTCYVSLNHLIYWRPHKTTGLVRNVTSGQAYNYFNTTSAILPSSLLFSNSSSNIYSSHSAKGARRHVEKLYFKETGVDMSCAGVVLAQKFKYKHIHLTSFSKMRSDVAAQVHFHIPTYDWHSSTNILVYTISRFSAPQWSYFCLTDGGEINLLTGFLMGWLSKISKHKRNPFNPLNAVTIYIWLH